MDYYPSYHYGHFEPYERPRIQQFYQPPVFMVHTPVPPQSLPRNNYRAYDKYVRKRFGNRKAVPQKLGTNVGYKGLSKTKQFEAGSRFLELTMQNFKRNFLLELTWNLGKSNWNQS